MKKTILCFVLLAVGAVFATESAHAQETASWTSGNKLMVHAGGSLPIAKFGEAYNLRASASVIGTTPAPTQSGTAEQVGNATIGFNAGISDMYKITPNLSIIGTLEVNYNPFNNSDYNRQINELLTDPNFLRDLANALGTVGVSGTGFNVKSSVDVKPYLTPSLLLGARYDIPVSAGLSFFASAQAGAILGLLPQLDFTQKVSVSILGISATIDQLLTRNSASAVAFAYKAGLGALINNQINVGVTYFAAAPQYSAGGEFKQNVALSGISLPIPGLGNSTTTIPAATVNQPVSMVQLTVGYILPF